jgi:CDP-L-myo-inositol myo-inositolphosphotransferase
MPLAGLPLIERAIRTILAAGIRDVVVVVGHEADRVAAVAKRTAPAAVRIVHAENWEVGNGASLAYAEPFVAAEDLFVLITVDHVFGDGTLERLLATRTPAVLVDHAPDHEAWMEGTRVRLDGERAIAFSKELGDPAIDCGAFLLSPEIFDAQRRAAARGDGTLAAAVTELVVRTGITAVELPHGAWWQDVDTPDDVRSALRLLRRSLAKPTDGPVSRFVNRPLSTRLSLALAALRPDPDAVSLVSFLVAVGGALALATRRGVLAALLIQAASILDGTDGELARLQLRASPAGALLDGFLDRVGDAAIVAGLAVWGLAVGDEPKLVAVIAVAAASASMLSMASKDRASSLGMRSPHERGISWLLGGRDARLLIVSISAAIGRPMMGLVVIAATAGVSVVTRVALAIAAARGVSDPARPDRR